jgi:hypothetical protein
MKNFFIKAVAISLSVFIAVFSAGCSDKNDEGVETSSISSEPESSEQASSVPSEEPESSASKEPESSEVVSSEETDDNVESKYTRGKLPLITPDGDISFDISTAAVAAPELTADEKSALEFCDNYLANYATYMAQLAAYDAQVEAAVVAGKTLPMDFALIDKTNPNVVYHYYVFVYSAEEYEVDGFIELAPDTTGYNVITEADLAV